MVSSTCTAGCGRSSTSLTRSRPSWRSDAPDPDEARDRVVGRIGEDGLRGVVLQHRGLLAEHGDAVAQLDRLAEVVGDEHDGLAQFGLQTQQFVLK